MKGSSIPRKRVGFIRNDRKADLNFDAPVSARASTNTIGEFGRRYEQKTGGIATSRYESGAIGRYYFTLGLLACLLRSWLGWMPGGPNHLLRIWARSPRVSRGWQCAAALSRYCRSSTTRRHTRAAATLRRSHRSVGDITVASVGACCATAVHPRCRHGPRVAPSGGDTGVLSIWSQKERLQVTWDPKF